MAKHVIHIKKTLEKTIVIDDDKYEDAENVCKYLYNKAYLQLHSGNSIVNVEFTNDTEKYKSSFSKFENIPESYEIQLARKKGMI